MLVFQVSLPVPHFSRINHSYQNCPVVPLMPSVLCVSFLSLVSVLNQQPPSAAKWQGHQRAPTPATLRPPSLPKASIFYSHRTQNTF